MYVCHLLAVVTSFISIVALGKCSKSLCKVTTDFLSLCRKGWTNSFGSVNYCLANGVFFAGDKSTDDFTWESNLQAFVNMVSIKSARVIGLAVPHWKTKESSIQCQTKGPSEGWNPFWMVACRSYVAVFFYEENIFCLVLTIELSY